MKVLIGANSALTKRLLRVVDQEDDVTIVGRSRPPDLNIEGNLRFIESNYLDSSWCSQIKNANELVVIFVGTNVQPNLIVNLGLEEISTVLKSEIEFVIKSVKELIPEMIKNQFGRFVFIGSKESSRGVMGGSLYSVVKNAHIGLSRSIAVEYGKFGITSNVIQLGYLPFGYSSKLKESEVVNLKKRIPTQKEIPVIEILNLIQVLSISQAINGTVIDVDQAVR
jgi:NAD(P)-dependent dehydrogenase (short-subunit alcohol dehydrogenase family)